MLCITNKRKNEDAYNFNFIRDSVLLLLPRAWGDARSYRNRRRLGEIRTTAQVQLVESKRSKKQGH